MSEVNAIETRYNGYRFRSRLEARWAIFFDQMEVPYLFESEGFEMGGAKYLPDFRLPNGLKTYGESEYLSNVWAEVKPSLTLEPQDKQKIALFVQQTDNVILILSGDPEPGAELRLIAHKAKGGEWFTPYVTWVELSSGELGLLERESLQSIDNPEMQAAIERLERTPRLMAAYAAARDARFEHGETPRVPHFRHEISCTSCGKQFIPSQPHHRLCYDCYLAERATKRTADSSVAATAPKPPTTPAARSRRWLYGFSALFIVLAVVVAGFTLMNREPGGRSNEVPDLPLDETNQLGNEPLSVPDRNIGVQSGITCDCTGNLYNCGDFETRNEAQACFDLCSPHEGDIHYLDSDQDGEACEGLP